MRTRRLLCVLPVLAACGGGDASVSIVFPNDVARGAIRRLRVEAYDPEAGSGPASARDCGDFIGKAREGDDPTGAPVRADYQCVETAQNKCESGWFDGREDLKIPRGRRIIYVLAFATTDEGATPILEGCTDRFDSDGGGDESDDVPIELELVIPDNARMVKSAGDRQVGRSTEELAVPLEVRVQADSPDGTGGTYSIPGVAIRFTSEAAGFELTSGDDPGRYPTFTDVEGRASVGVRLPMQAGSGEVTAFAAALETDGNEDRATRTFSVSVTDPVAFPSKDVLSPANNTLPIAVALGNLDGVGGLDLAVVTCQGQRANCTAGLDAVAPLGNTQLIVVADVGNRTGRRQLTAPTNLGVLPADLVIENIAPPEQTDEIVLLNSRRGDCQARRCPANGPCKCYGRGPGDPCPCEGSEILVLDGSNGATVDLSGRFTMTGSNAVAMTTFESSRTNLGRAVAIVAQGRSVDERPCSRANRCLPFEGPECATNPAVCGCPPAERCECPDCNNTNEPGVCVARDKMVDVLRYQNSPTTTGLFNDNGCQEPMLICDNQNPQNSTCRCGDSALRKNACNSNDGCNCRVPDRVYVGDTDAPVLPYAIVAAPFQEGTSWDLVVPSVGGLELVEATANSFEWKGEPIINAPVHDAVAVGLDLASESMTAMNPPPDVVWSSREPCLQGANFEQSCRIWRELPEDVESRGCLGVYFTDGAASIFTLRTPSVGGCRRHQLEFEPHGMCAGEFNGDGHVDIALASRDMGSVAIFSGDGRGGLLDPPALEALPGDAGGPVACGDVDGDGLDDLVVVNGNTGAVYVLGTRPN